MNVLKTCFKIAVVILATLKIFPASADPGKFPGFQSADIDRAAGSFSVSNHTFHLRNSTGSNGTFFVFQPFSGNGQITARVRRSAKPLAKAGLIFRLNTNGVSPSAGVFRAHTNTTFERLPDVKQPPIVTVLTNETFEWLRIVREGNAFTGFQSTDGTNWILFSADSIEMPDQIFAGLSIIGTGEADFENVQMTSAQLTSPPQRSQFVVPTNILIKADLKNFGDALTRVDFFSGPSKIGDATPSGTMIWTNVWAAEHSITARITTRSGATFFTEPALCEIKSPPTAVTFLRTDFTTKGNWKNIYGSDGFIIAGHATNLPPFVRWDTTGFRNHTWAYASKEERCLMLSSSEERIASSWSHRKQLEIDLKLSDGNPHRIAIYFLDWDRNNRSTLVEVISPTNNNVLDSQTITSFSEGRFLVWSLVGHVTIRITALRGNASISGIFFDPEKE